ncbi:MAG: redoxin domain-containing protein [Bacteroidota bacterium]
MSLRPGFLLLLLISAATYGQSGYKMDFKVKGLKDTTVLLAYHNGEQNYLKDTAKVDSRGNFSFEDPKSLAQGAFMLVIGKNTLFEFVLGADQRFSMESDTADLIGHMVVNGDEDNKLYFENANFIARKFKEADPYVKILKDSTLKPDAKKQAREEFTKVSTEVVNFQNDLIAKHPTTLTARLIKSTKEIVVPDPPKRPDGTIDSTWQFKYYREHYWDNFDLADDALIRLPRPVYSEKVKDYFDRLFLQQSDTITREIVRLTGKIKKNPEAYKYFVWLCLNHYYAPKIMGLDQVYVNLYDKFIATGEMDYWLPKKSKQDIKDYVDKLRVSMIGGNAANLIMQDKDLKAKSMYDFKNKYTVLYIFNPDCGHCREEMPKLVEFYNKSKAKYDFEVYAVSIDTSIAKMKKFMQEFKVPFTTVNGPRTYVGHWSKFYYAETTPSMYVIDTKHKIIAKKLPIEQLEDFLTKYGIIQQNKKPNGNKGT